MTDARKSLPELVHEITPELFAEIEAHEKKLEALKDTDPKEYERIMTGQAKLRRALYIMRENARKKS